MNWKAIVAFVVGLALGIALIGAASELLEAKKRSWSKRTAADCRTMSVALEAYRQDNRTYPPLDGNIEHLVPYLVPKYLRTMPTRDMANQPYLVVMNGANAAVVSVGAYGAAAEGGRIIRGPWVDSSPRNQVP